MSVAFNKYYCFVQDIGRKVHNLNSDTLKIALTNTAPDVSTDAVLTDIGEITAGYGYSAGGSAATGVTYAQALGVGKLSGTGPVITASGGSIGPFRYAVLYNSTASGKNLIGYWDYGSAVTLNSGEKLTVTFSALAGVFTLQ